MQMVIQERASLGEAISGFLLLMSNYRKKGYITLSLVGFYTFISRFCDCMWKVYKFNQDPSKGQITVAKETLTKRICIVGTLCAEVNPRTTPIEKIFPVELAMVRNSAQSFVYISSFAVAPSYQCTRLCLRMLRNLWSTVKEQGIDIGICVVHPDHSTFYERFGFTEIARSINMTVLHSAPAALLVIKRQDVLL